MGDKEKTPNIYIYKHILFECDSVVQKSLVKPVTGGTSPHTPMLKLENIHGPTSFRMFQRSGLFHKEKELVLNPKI